jgi:hypothetical protein
MGNSLRSAGKYGSDNWEMAVDKFFGVHHDDERRLGSFLRGILRGMTTEKLTRPWLRRCTTALAAGGLGLSALGLTAGIAQAVPAPAPAVHHHWCPGDNWDQGWGNNSDWNNCHDWDDNVAAGPYGYGAPAWAAPPPPFWAPWAQVVWNPNVNGWGFWNGPGIWISL